MQKVGIHETLRELVHQIALGFVKRTGWRHLFHNGKAMKKSSRRLVDHLSVFEREGFAHLLSCVVMVTNKPANHEVDLGLEEHTYEFGRGIIEASTFYIP